ncbi:MAG: prephenate dehydrogenase/arogenate dehydrogenase family protein [Deltaproteobacteria bacterium]|nr:prephenate dehydrogenase/arogenate dehydrogenase family protein [Deltaproteobacteria bacterium]
MAFRRVVIAGFGLIGASFALAVRRVAPATVIEAVDVPEQLARLRGLSAADRVESVDALPRLAVNADLVVLAAPAQHIPMLIDDVAGAIGPGTLVTDVAGAKSAICAHAAKTLGGGAFIGGHPMSGSERSGAYAADALLFHQRPWILCPLPGVNPDRMLDLIRFVESLGARPITLDPAEHDRLVAMISHLPQLLATALMRTVGGAVEDRDLAFKIAGNGFRDMTRLAASDFRPWSGVLSGNRADIERALDEFEATWRDLRRRLRDGEIEGLWNEAATMRRRVLDRTLEAVPRTRPLVDAKG